MSGAMWGTPRSGLSDLNKQPSPASPASPSSPSSTASSDNDIQAERGRCWQMRAGAETCQVCVTRNMTDRTDRQSEIRVNFCHETHRTNIYISLSSEYFPVRLGWRWVGSDWFIVVFPSPVIMSPATCVEWRPPGSGDIRQHQTPVKVSTQPRD